MASAASALVALRSDLARRFPDAMPLAQGLARPVASGVAPLDEILPGGGFPRGKLTAWHSEGGATALLRMACRTVVANGERATWIDAAGTLTPFAENLGGTLIVRPTAAPHALSAADALLRSGGLALLVLAGAPLPGSTAMRLTHAARDGGAALVVLAPHTPVAGLRLESRFLPHAYQWVPGPFDRPAAPRFATAEIRVRTLGWQARTTIVLPVVPYELRLSLDPALPDRRGIERRVRRPARARW